MDQTTVEEGAGVVQRLMRTLRKPTTVDETGLSAQMERGARAEALLGDEMLQQAFRDIETIYLRAWRQSDAHDVEGRERAHVAVCVLDDLRNQLLAFVRDGAVARERLEKALHR